jgi:hypothetical protein
VAAFFVAAPARSGCVSPGEVTEAVLAQVPDAAPVTHGGAVAGRLLALFNATPPVTEAAADRAIVYASDRLAEVLAVLFQDGCRIGAVRIPATAYRSLLRGVTGVAT